MGVVTDIQPLLDASRQRAELAAKPALKVAETPAEYGKTSVLTDAKAIAVYAQLKTAGLDTPTCLQATALAAKIKIFKASELGTRTVYDSAIWQTLPNSAIVYVRALTSTDYITPQQYTVSEQSLSLVWQSGAMIVLFFDALGLVIQRLEMAETCCRIIKVPAHVYYTLVTSTSCIYLALSSQNPALQTAEWAPAENQPSYRQQLDSARIGDRITFSTP